MKQPIVATLDQVLDSVMQLSLEQREMLIEIVQKRHIENRRAEIAEDAQTTIAEFKAGNLRPQPVDAIIAELRRSLDEPSQP